MRLQQTDLGYTAPFLFADDDTDDEDSELLEKAEEAIAKNNVGAGNDFDLEEEEDPDEDDDDVAH